MALPISSEGFSNYCQIIHLDAYCNECGNCATFCPWNGKPYTDKVTVFSLQSDFENSANPGFFVTHNTVMIRSGGEVFKTELCDGNLSETVKNRIGKMADVFAALYTSRPSLFGPVQE